MDKRSVLILSWIQMELHGQRNLLLRIRILKSISRMEDTQVIDVLYVALSKVETNSVFLGGKMQGVEGLCLGFGDGRDIGGAREGVKTCEVATGVLDD